MVSILSQTNMQTLRLPLYNRWDHDANAAAPPPGGCGRKCITPKWHHSKDRLRGHRCPLRGGGISGERGEGGPRSKAAPSPGQGRT